MRLRWVAAFAVDGLTGVARAGGVARLNHEVLDHAVEEAAVVVPLQAVMHKIPARLRRLLLLTTAGRRKSKKYRKYYVVG